jgi:hypothetical protein
MNNLREQMSTDAHRPASRSSMTPLWVISLFVTLTETFLIVGVIRTNGGIQLALTVFVIVFALLVAGAFFAILWNRPYVLFSPTEFGQQDVQVYVEAMQRKTVNENELYTGIQVTIRATLASSEFANELSETVSSLQGGQQVEEKVEQLMISAADRTVENVREERFVQVNPSPLVEMPVEPWYMPHGDIVTVSDFLDSIWFLLIKYGIPAETYGALWALRDAKTGRVIKDMGRRWARSQGQGLDTRSLSDVGIFPGTRLEAIRLTKKRNSSYE